MSNIVKKFKLKIDFSRLKMKKQEKIFKVKEDKK